MEAPFSRTEILLGTAAVEKLAAARVAVFGLGGVGSYAAEALARSGIGHLSLIDHDRVSQSNLNRQLPATLDTLGQLKVEVMARRIGRINPKAVVETHPIFYGPGEGGELFNLGFDYIVDALDTVSAKVDLIVKSRELAIPIVSAMGAGNRLDPRLFQVADISASHTCPLARVMRRELRRRGLQGGVKVVFSTEPPLKPRAELGEGQVAGASGRGIIGSIAFVPPVAGLFLAGVVMRDILAMGEGEEERHGCWGTKGQNALGPVK